ncbi:choline/carnitine O-acyltransferase [Streptomyces sp. DSM 44917]|uniref:Choline/carnitine O-acyltransferase n=1 Tax=Streptomyces boetiae TaxID=3075541 RepID=A0ABU2LD55_9ACTN|nr:choline/carnitine O-acyltransferase [Streptomyces sp. DSM 44917]MDT0309515.1 choline/carnitine O-acyltransferase [Streptomyces sp. DSM 44917]
MHFDTTGKISLDHIYTQPDPRHYFTTLRRLDYRIPQLAKPYFARLLDEYRQARRVTAPTVLDIGCSYGINAALLTCDLTMDELYRRYGAEAVGALSRETLLTRDRELVRGRQRPGRARFTGLDTSRPALSYALAAGFLDAAVHADLEGREPTPRETERLAAADLIISTGCFGYVTERTLTRVVEAHGDRRPWMAHFVLRMFPFESVTETLAGEGYETVRLDRTFKQRRFASPEEQSLVLDTLSDVGVDPQGLETDGWLYAQLHLSRPRAAHSAVIPLAAGQARLPHSQPPSAGTNVNSSQEPTSARTFEHEDTLPRVPLPALEDTCRRFTEWSAPLLTEEERAETAAAVEEFLREDSPARTLHAALEAYDATEGVHSWLDTFWPSRYLGRRDRIALNANFFFLFQDTDQGQVDRAAGLIAAAVHYKKLLDEERVPPVTQRGRPLSMEQNKFLFSATRIPGAEQDTVRVPYTGEWPGPSAARHIVVFHRGNAFRMDVIGPDGAPHSLDDLTAGLRDVLKAGAVRAAPDTSVGHLTTKARAEWAASRQALLAAAPGNAAALEEIETALFCVCLEDVTPGDTLNACDLLLHGDSGNRWFDKAVSLIVFEDGRAGINVEHCGLDGTTILSFVDALLGTPAEEQSAASGARSQGLPPVELIEFTLDEALRSDIAAAGASFAAYAEATATTTVSFEDFGQNRAKQLRISPDAFVQMAYQLAHQRSKGHIGATYESIATRQYRRGRTEAMRVVTPEVLAFVAAMEDPGADTAARLAAFRAAADAHVRRAKECQAGEAPEQHLWELQLIQKRRGAELGATEPLTLYGTPGWVKMRDDYLSTSSAPSKNIQYFGFGSTSDRCIGVAYVLLPDRFNLYLSTPRPVAEQMHVFADRLRVAVAELQDLLATEQPPA